MDSPALLCRAPAGWLCYLQQPSSDPKGPGAGDIGTFPLLSRSPSSRRQGLWSAALRATRGFLHCLKTLANSCLLCAQPGCGQQRGSLRPSTLGNLRVFPAETFFLPSGLRGGRTGVGRQGWAWVLWNRLFRLPSPSQDPSKKDSHAQNERPDRLDGQMDRRAG